MFGDGRNFVRRAGHPRPRRDRRLGRGERRAPASYAEIVASDAGQTMVQGYVEELNGRLNRWETIKKWELLDHDLSVESGELTPSMKVQAQRRRGATTRRCIEEMYA